MVGKKQGSGESGKKDVEKAARCLAIATEGISTGAEFAEMMSALMTDLIVGAITPQIGNAVCNAGGKLLKVVELQIKYGKPQKDGHQNPVLNLTG